MFGHISGGKCAPYFMRAGRWHLFPRLYGDSSKNYYQQALCASDGPTACVLCKSSGHTANYLGFPRAPKRKTNRKVTNNKKAPRSLRPRRAKHPRARSRLIYHTRKQRRARARTRLKMIEATRPPRSSSPAVVVLQQPYVKLVLKIQIENPRCPSFMPTPPENRSPKPLEDKSEVRAYAAVKKSP
ncbi:hypothetical protein EVAR_60085_1 [Eumeta japonica]|uniref:Uncharacterized protein n=1 Tax=Eumeta variegata TaxID=151549 RepID=A0A4C1YLM2_EUMVA|nr:hypothetical protein EVAR_60085_1 [Eumeta japonica]